jgi:hypothetical protein
VNLDATLHGIDSIVDRHAKMLENKTKLLLLKLIHFFAREVLLVKKIQIEETKTT